MIDETAIELGVAPSAHPECLPAADTHGDRSAAVSLQHVSKDYVRGKVVVPVLREFSLEIAHGEFVALMGASGSGKSTLLNLIGGIDRPSAGSILVNGTDIGRHDRSRLARWRGANVGFIFQLYNLLPALSAAQNIELPLLLRRLPRAERARRVAAALELVGMRDRAAHKPAELSGGQQQRVAIARALIADPPMLLCDEPTGDLDCENADQVIDMLRLLHRERGKTIILATHDPAAAEAAQRVVRLSKPARP